MVILDERVKLPSHFRVENELRDQLSSRPGHQRCIEGHGEMLLILHEVPGESAERTALYFWHDYEGRWFQSTGPGVSGVGDLLGRYATAIYAHARALGRDDASEIFRVLRLSAPLHRSIRNIVQAIEQVLSINPEDREIRAFRDRAREIELAAELLSSDAKTTLDFQQAERMERQLQASTKLERIVRKLGLALAILLPLFIVDALFDVNVDLPDFFEPVFLGILVSGLVIAGTMGWLRKKQSR